MQGSKKFTPKLFLNFRLPDHIPDDNFYKVLKNHLNLNFIYQKTKEVYSHTGRPSLDPVVFFKCLLIGYFENICSDRALERIISLRLDLLYFIDHDIGERPPDHSTICKTRKRIPVEVFEEVFNHILYLCIEAGLVKGKIQSIDSAYINANAGLDKMVEIKMIDRDPLDFLNEVKKQDEYSDEDIDNARKRMKKNQKTLEKYTEHRRKKYSKLEGGREHKKNKRRFLSNATHMSATDPDARIAKKSGKPRMLCYTSLMGVDAEANVITHMSAEHASKKDSRLLLKATKNIQDRLSLAGLKMKTVLADAGFSSGENYCELNLMGLDAYIPIHGGYVDKRVGFEYNLEEDVYVCPKGKKLTFRFVRHSNGHYNKQYATSTKDCKNCPLKSSCANKRGFKKIEHTIFKEEYIEMIQRLKSRKGKKSYGLRMQTVEPIFGTLQQHYGLRFINARGRDSAHKIMLMAASALNLKKWIKNMLEKAEKSRISIILRLISIVNGLIKEFPIFIKYYPHTTLTITQ